MKSALGRKCSSNFYSIYTGKAASDVVGQPHSTENGELDVETEHQQQDKVTLSSLWKERAVVSSATMVLRQGKLKTN